MYEKTEGSGQQLFWAGSFDKLISKCPRIVFFFLPVHSPKTTEKINYANAVYITILEKDRNIYYLLISNNFIFPNC